METKFLCILQVIYNLVSVIFDVSSSYRHIDSLSGCVIIGNASLNAYFLNALLKGTVDEREDFLESFLCFVKIIWIS